MLLTVLSIVCVIVEDRRFTRELAEAMAGYWERAGGGRGPKGRGWGETNKGQKICVCSRTTLTFKWYKFLLTSRFLQRGIGD